jgi:hypothetical protein
LFPKGRNPRADLFSDITADTTATANLFPVALGGGRPDIEFGTSIIGYPQTYRDRQTTSRMDYALSERNQFLAQFISGCSKKIIGCAICDGAIPKALTRHAFPDVWMPLIYKLCYQKDPYYDL